MSDSYKVYASKDYVDSKGLPEGQGAYQQLVTDANGVAKWEDKLAYTNTLLSVQSPNGAYAWYKVSDEPLTGIEDVDMDAEIAVWLNGERGKSWIVLKQDDFIAVSELLVVAVLRDDCTIELNGVKFGHFPKRGMYFVANADVAVTAVAIDMNATEPDISWDKNTETIKPIDPKYLPTIVFKKKIGAAITCNVDFATFESRLSEGAAMVMVNDGDYGLETSSNLSAYYDSDNSYWVIHAEFNSETKYYNILFSANSLSVELK